MTDYSRRVSDVILAQRRRDRRVSSLGKPGKSETTRNRVTREQKTVVTGKKLQIQIVQTAPSIIAENIFKHAISDLRMTYGKTSKNGIVHNGTVQDETSWDEAVRTEHYTVHWCNISSHTG